MSLILAGDIGGTKTLLQLARVANGNFDIVHQQRFVSADFETFDAILQDFIGMAERHGPINLAAGCIGVAGPVDTQGDHQVAAVTNLPWRLDADALARQFSIPRLCLINDFQAIGFGVEVLASDDLISLHAGVPVQRAPRVLIGAGTGLGQAIMVWRGDAESGFYDILSSEGGHGDYAPGDNEQRALVQYLASRVTRVTTETVLSGPGLVNVFEFLAQQQSPANSETVRAQMARGDAAAAIGQAALQDKHPLACAALNLFVRVYGTQAGNLALTCMAQGGVYIAGGIAPRIQTFMQNGNFMQAFQDKAPMNDVIRKIPVNLVLDSELGLKGAACVAARMADSVSISSSR